YRRHELDGRAELLELAIERVPLAYGGSMGALVARPALRVHPRIDGVADREVLGPAHQQAATIVMHGHFTYPPGSKAGLLLEHDLFRKPVPTFRDHAYGENQAARRRRLLSSSSRSTASKRSSAQSRSSRAMMSGGARRTTVWCVSFESTPFASR